MIYIAVDPGLGGAVCILDGSNVVIHATPIEKTKTGKSDFVISKMVELLQPYANDSVVFFLENVGALPGNGNVSMFNFGRGKGLWEGIAHALGFDVHLARPQVWKQYYPLLKAEPVEKPQILKDKCPRGANEKNEYKAVKKDYERLKRLAKAASKSKAREIASQLYPALASQFKKVNSDGRAEALLMALYVREQTQARSKKCRKKK
jgi:hypothetical protein